MSGTYNLKDLLNLIAQQGAAELRLEPERPPMMLLNGKLRVLDGPALTSDHITELLNGIATDEQRRELDLCGSVHFTYAAEHSTHFRVRAGIHGQNVSLSITNLLVRETIPGRPLRETNSHAALSPDGGTLVVGLVDGTLAFFNAWNGALIPPTAHTHPGLIFQFSFSPDGKWIATMTGTATSITGFEPSIWDMATHNLVAAPVGHTDTRFIGRLLS